MRNIPPVLIKTFFLNLCVLGEPLVYKACVYSWHAAVGEHKYSTAEYIILKCNTLYDRDIKNL